MSKEYYTITEYAKLKGLSRQGVYYRIKKGLLVAEHIAGRWLIPKHD